LIKREVVEGEADAVKLAAKIAQVAERQAVRKRI
jgi:hypothetical protein